MKLFPAPALVIGKLVTAREIELSNQLAQCQQELEIARRENESLRQKIDLLARRIFGKSSEQLNRSQLERILNLSQAAEVKEEAPVVAAPVQRPVRKARAPRLPDNLPVVEEVIDPEPVKAQPQDWRLIGQKISEQLDYEPARFAPPHRSSQIRSSHAKGQRAGDRALAGTVVGPELAGAGVAGPDFGGQVLRSSSPLPAGADFCAAPRGSFTPANPGSLGGNGGASIYIKSRRA